MRKYAFFAEEGGRNVIQERLDQICEANLTVRCKESYEMTPTECWHHSPFYLGGEFIAQDRGVSIQPWSRKK